MTERRQMSSDELRALLLELVDQDPAAERFRDALHDRLHLDDPDDIPKGTPLDDSEVLDEEIRRTADEIRDYLELLDEERRLAAFHRVIAGVCDSAGRQSGLGRNLHDELERIDKRHVYLMRRKADREADAAPVLKRLSLLIRARDRLAASRDTD